MNANFLNDSVDEDKERASRERQKRKVVGYFANGENVEVIKGSDYQPEQREMDWVYGQMNEGGIGDKEERRLSRQIQGTAERFGAEKVMVGDEEKGIEGIWGHRQEQRILAMSTKVGFDSYQIVEAKDLEEFLKKYPTPIDFEGRAEQILESIRRYNPEEKYLQYVDSMESFQNKVYGKKYEYALALKELHADAEEWASVPEFRGERRDDESANDGKDKLDAENAELMKMQARLEKYRMSAETAELVMGRTRLENDPLLCEDGTRKRWQVEDLHEAELEPRYGIRIEGVNMGFSDMFRMKGNRDAVIGYVDTGDGQVVARSYYRSNSHGVWRYMPDRLQDLGGNVIWYGKGQSEEAVTLPSEVQMFLNMMGTVQESKMGRRTRKRAADLQGARREAFYGVAKAVRYGDYYGDRMAGKINDSLAREVNVKPQLEFVGHVPPEDMHLPSEVEPDYEQQVGEYEVHSRTYGEVRAKIFLSQDKRLKWTIMEDSRGRAWVGQVETKAPITSTGCRAEWVSAGDWGMPAYEYTDQTMGYGDYYDVSLGYVSMWRNYLSKVPMIKRYKALGKRNSA